MNERDSDEYKEARKAAIKRDGGKCQYPGCKSRRKIEVHHITPYSKWVAGRCDVENLICVCRAHHLKLKGYEHVFAPTFRLIIEQKKKQKK